MRVVLDNGTSIELGETEATPTIGITDYSRRVTDDYGVTTVVPRGFSRRMSVKLALPFNRVSAVQQQLADLRATSPLWVADDSLAWLSVRGFYKDFDLDHAVPPLSYCTLTIEGLAETSTAVDDGRDPAPIGATSTLQLLQPGTVDDRVLASSSVAENDYPEWSATAVYPVAARVIRASTHRIYESVADGNVGSDPTGLSGKWLDVGPTNRWAMFDHALGSVTTAANAITVALSVTGIDALALLDVIGATVRVQAPDYDRTLANTGGAITFVGLPTAAVRVTVTISGSGQVSVGTLLVGRMLNLGITEASPTAGITDYSRKVVDDFGEVTVVQRAWAKRMSAKALIRTDAVDAVANRIAAVRALPSLWIGQTGLDSLTVYGFFKDFSIEVGSNVSKLSLSIEGLSKAPPPAALPQPPIIAWPDIANPDGTKPADNADVTGDNTSKDTHAVFGRTAQDVVEGMDINLAGNLAQGLRQDQLALLTDARDFHEGQLVKDIFLSFREAQITENGVTNTSVELIGAQTSDATASVLDLKQVVIDGAEATARRLEDVEVTNGLVTANVSQLMEAVIEPDGSGNAKFVLRGDVNGVIVGVAGTTDGKTGRLAFAADQYDFVDTDGGNAINILSYDNGRWTFNAEVYVTSIDDGVVTTRNLAAGSVTGLITMSFPDQPVGPSEVTLAELTGPSAVVVGDGVDGMALIDVQFTQDGSTTVDTSMRVRAYLDVGAGYVMVRDTVQGIQVSSGNARWILSQSFSIPVMSAGSARFKLTATGNSLGGGPTSGSFARNIQLNIFGGKR